MIIYPSITALFCFTALLFAWQKPAWQRKINLIGTLAYTAFALIIFITLLSKPYLSMNMSNWSAPYGIVLCADLLSGSLVLISGIIASCVAIYSFTDIRLSDLKSGFYPVFQLLLLGLSGVFFTADLFNLYVWFEVILMSSFILLVLSGGKFQLEGAIKYAVLNLIATLLLLAAIAFLYGFTGSLNFADIAENLQHTAFPGFLMVIASLFVIAFGMKAALFPLFFWLPASYHTTRHSSAAMLASLLSKVGVYAIIRFLTLFFPSTFTFAHSLVLVLALLTLLIGIMGAIAHFKLRQVLAFVLISHIGFMLLGVALLNDDMLTGSIMYMFQHMLLIAFLFLLGGLIRHYRNTSGNALYLSRPGLSTLFFIGALAISGVPPFSGFWPKLYFAKACMSSHDPVLIIFILLISLTTLYVMIRLWHNIFYSEPTGPKTDAIKNVQPMWIACSILFVLILAITLDPQALSTVARHITEQLLQTKPYILAILEKAQ